ncbi:hypothetical protein D8B22_09970 [Verminephrobacter aporrectodeae subsp. tuberculatae]|uniref:hypothetical protein n=1 Tax=Verminephrobacter aporrectodeae TaxID=1110389 RepID=UPI002242DF4B|nr:hypothetical protein [Verminephrobacter aporrectodeae]MCW8165285.1 hypothetical protein [Verminephrobacter aporrectodeae subsp. tuberculatae]MCW8169421.1 hypothetical protein [Verminephrobacter aporrectodeae subsp. tuberculatae]
MNNKPNRSARVTLAVALVATSAIASTESTEEKSTMSQEASISAALLPSTHVQADRRAVTVDGERAVLTRFIRDDGRNAGLGGEHFSTVFSETGVLKGFTNMSLELVGKPLPTRERTEQIARSFLQDKAPDLLERMEISWIEPHDEPLKTVRNGRTEVVTLTGMKVKARNLADGRWFWVIVGRDEKPMVFERDIVWISFPGKRKTEKWLHDAWLVEQPASTSTAGV